MMVTFKDDFTKSKSPKGKHITNECRIGRNIQCSYALFLERKETHSPGFWYQKKDIKQHLLRTNFLRTKCRPGAQAPEEWEIHVHMDNMSY